MEPKERLANEFIDEVLKDADNYDRVDKTIIKYAFIAGYDAKVKEETELPDWPYRGICGKCQRYASKLTKDCLCADCVFFGVRPSTTDHLPEDILRFVKPRF